MKQETLIKELKRYCKAHHIKQVEVAFDLGVTVLTIGRYFSGEKRRMHELTRNAIEQYLRLRGAI